MDQLRLPSAWQCSWLVCVARHRWSRVAHTQHTHTACARAQVVRCATRVARPVRWARWCVSPVCVAALQWGRSPLQQHARHRTHTGLRVSHFFITHKTASMVKFVMIGEKLSHGDGVDVHPKKIARSLARLFTHPPVPVPRASRVSPRRPLVPWLGGCRSPYTHTHCHHGLVSCHNTARTQCCPHAACARVARVCSCV